VSEFRLALLSFEYGRVHPDQREKVNNKVSPIIRRENKKGCNHPLGVCDYPRTHQQFPCHSQFSIFCLELDDHQLDLFAF
jgi:hypothetical protein